MKLKTKLLAGAGSLVMAGGMMAAAAPSAYAVPTLVGTCQNNVSLVKITSPTKGVGLTDQTVDGIKIAGGLAKDQTTKALVNGGGNCVGLWRPGDPHNPGHSNASPINPLTPKAQATALLGNASCANGATATAVDANAADAYPLNGKISWTFTQTYFDPIAAVTKPYKMQADISLLGFSAAAPDVVDVGGIVLSGVNAGATLATTASNPGNQSEIWEDPVAKTGGASGYNTGYELDLASAAGCADGTPNNANLTLVLSGGGAASPSLLGSTANGLNFEFQQ